MQPQKTPPPPSRHSDEEAVNPYAGGLAGDSPAPAEPAAPAPRAVPVTARKRLPVGLIIAGASAILLIGGAIAGISLLTADHAVNQKPSAAIAPVPDKEYRIQDVITLSGAPSTDPEGKALSYTWNFLSPADASIIYNDPSTNKLSEKRLFSTNSPEIKVQFLSAGEMKLELQVYDGALYSDPVTTTVTVKPLGG
jgi:hypothetical protein